MGLQRKDGEITSASQDIMLDECNAIYCGSVANKGTC